MKQTEEPCETTPLPQDSPSAIGADPHLVVLDARDGKRLLDIPLGEPPAGMLNTLDLYFLKGDSVVEVSTGYEITWRVDLTTHKIIRAPGDVKNYRSHSGRFMMNEGKVFDFDNGEFASGTWWTDVDPDALKD